MRHVIRADVPFAGSTQSYLLDDGTVAYTDGLTPEQYSADRGFPVRVITDAQLDELIAAYVESRRTPPEPITAERYDDMLNVLPPSRWHTRDGVELFHVCERITHDLVNWFAKVGDQHFAMVDRAGVDTSTLSDAVKRRLAQP